MCFHELCTKEPSSFGSQSLTLTSDQPLAHLQNGRDLLILQGLRVALMSRSRRSHSVPKDALLGDRWGLAAS